MDKEAELLEYIAKDQAISQRELSSKTGLSLGNINLLIKKLVKKGLIKIEKLKPNSFRYILTAKGLAEKSKRTYNYIIHSVQFILKVKQVLLDILKLYIDEKHYQVYLYGGQDEVCEIIAETIKEKHYSQIDHIQNLEQKIIESEQAVIIVWDCSYEAEVIQKGYQYINILSYI
ncbi:MAG: winged helix-turn-helix transcriptional regulator [Clostridia bacterium]